MCGTAAGHNHLEKLVRIGNIKNLCGQFNRHLKMIRESKLLLMVTFQPFRFI